ncbi:GNAT family N-acetyltransferase [Brevibacillus choshinensis]|uniref:GNAT family N-acetyltransferase n=1 Tax=Brevibacillus choshinensis TaxID=54911 RepID=UPI002E20D2C9|nr:GNAT family N-acetyltransferase [Brevibacillus choshinensis]
MTSKKEIIIRSYSEKDEGAIRQYCLPEEQAIYTSLPTDIIKTFQEDLHNQPYVIYADDQLVGCFVLYTAPSGNLYTSSEHALIFKSFSIDARHQKKGYAYETLRSLGEIAKQSFPDKNEILLTVHHTNIPAINLYLKAGFVDKGLRYAGTHGEELIMHLEWKKG